LLLYFFIGIIPSPLFDDLFFLAWECCNNLILFWLFYSLLPSTTYSVIYLDIVASIS
ncbi:hypothetical protein HN873_005561, partial [Arachis hypogaea]